MYLCVCVCVCVYVYVCAELTLDLFSPHSLNARFGTVAVPNIMLFHQSRSAVRFNHTERHFQTLVQFITNTTGNLSNEVE